MEKVCWHTKSVIARLNWWFYISKFNWGHGCEMANRIFVSRKLRYIFSWFECICCMNLTSHSWNWLANFSWNHYMTSNIIHITPLVFSVSAGMGKDCSMFHKHVAEGLAIKTGERYEIFPPYGVKVISNPQISFDMCTRKTKS